MSGTLVVNDPYRSEGTMLSVNGLGQFENRKEYTVSTEEINNYTAVTGQAWPEDGKLIVGASLDFEPHVGKTLPAEYPVSDAPTITTDLSGTEESPPVEIQPSEPVDQVTEPAGETTETTTESTTEPTGETTVEGGVS